MKTKLIIILCIVSCLGCYTQNNQEKSRWQINPSGSITWHIDSRIPHNDHIEMSGEQLSVVLRYGVDENGSFMLERSFIWPMLRTIPNNTHASLMRRFGWDIIGDMITVNSRRVTNEKVKRITLNGVMKVESEFGMPKDGKMALTRYLFPSTKKSSILRKIRNPQHWAK